MAAKKKQAAATEKVASFTEATELETLRSENAVLKDLIREFGHHLIENEDMDWICAVCGKHEPLEVEVKDFKHEEYCPLRKGA